MAGWLARCDECGCRAGGKHWQNRSEPPKAAEYIHDYYVLTDGTQILVDDDGWATFSDGTPSCKVRREGDEIILLTADGILALKGKTDE